MAPGAAVDEEKDASALADPASRPSRWRRLMTRRSTGGNSKSIQTSSSEDEEVKNTPEKWSLGILNDKVTDEVPGSVLLMSHATRNEPLGLHNAPARTSASSLPSPYPPGSRSSSMRPSWRRKSVEKKRTADGKIILEPQPEDTLNDPLNWPAWRRDVALLSLGFYCMLGGGMTPVLAAGFQNVSKTYNVSISRVALTTGLYMMGLGLGSVIASPTAIIWGKRPVYLIGIVLFIISAVWCALSPSYTSLVIARIFMGFAVSPCECLPSATIAEIFYLHERAYRLGVYTLLLLSGKNLVPLVSAAIIQSLDWRWVFWIIAIVVGFCLSLMFFFVPETFWDRTPHPTHSRKQALQSISRFFHHPLERRSTHNVERSRSRKRAEGETGKPSDGTIARRRGASHHIGFADQLSHEKDENLPKSPGVGADDERQHEGPEDTQAEQDVSPKQLEKGTGGEGEHAAATEAPHPTTEEKEKLPDSEVQNLQVKEPDPQAARPSPHFADDAIPRADYFSSNHGPTSAVPSTPHSLKLDLESTHSHDPGLPTLEGGGGQHYTAFLRTQPPKTYAQTLKPWNGKLRTDKWYIVAIRPFVLFAYPAILWSTLVYSLSIGWLIVLSEAVSEVYKSPDTYNFTSLQAGLVYVSPFVGGILGTAVAGKVSDILVRFMSRRNGGVYEPEFRLIMAIPIAISTCIGLMGFGWSAEERDAWIVPTVFFGIISFGCSLGSTTAITFAVDSYRQYAGEALVTLNFSKNIFHGLVFSLFFNNWLAADGSRKTFIAIGSIQLACLLTTIPMYIYGKRARMWTVRRDLMGRL